MQKKLRLQNVLFSIVNGLHSRKLKADRNSHIFDAINATLVAIGKHKASKRHKKKLKCIPCIVNGYSV